MPITPKIKRQRFASSRETSSPKSPTNSLSNPEHANPKNYVEIFDLVEQNSCPYDSQLFQYQEKPHQQLSDPEHPSSKKRAFFEICPRKNPPPASHHATDHWPPATDHCSSPPAAKSPLKKHHIPR
jgi:hypothetical protein